MSVNLFGYSGSLEFLEKEGRYIAIIKNPAFTIFEDPKEIEKYIMFLQYVELHLRELNS